MKHKVKHVHFVGIGGSGMSGIAEVLLNLGYQVSGSDLSGNATTQRLKSLGATVHVGHAGAQVATADVVVTSTAVKPDNPEVIAARERKIPVVPRAMMLAELLRLRQGIAIAGTHGKTTTTSLIASVLAQAGMDPTFVIGGRLEAAGSHAKLGKGEFIVVEADESDASFLYLQPVLAVVTNIDADHMETYGHDFGKLKQAFVDFVQHLPFYGMAILCVDDANVREIMPSITKPITTYGLSASAQVRAADIRHSGGQMHFTALVGVNGSTRKLGITLNLPGLHNVQNALAAIAVGNEVGVPDAAIIKALAEFSGVGRRFQRYGEIKLSSGGSFALVDDYGHHPVEMAATLAAARGAFPGRRLVLAFQPHRYTRTRDLFEDFVKVLSTADVLLLSEIYSAGEAPIVAADSKSLIRALRVKGEIEPLFVETVDELPAAIRKVVQDGDVVLVMGAGSVGGVAPGLAKDEEGINMSEINKLAQGSPALRGEMRVHEPMKKHTSWRAGGAAERFYIPADLADLAQFLRGLPQAEPVHMVGLGSNLLVRDGGVRGTVVLLHARLNELRTEHETDGLIYAGAGLACAKVARFAALHDLAGAEFLAGIPGTVGGALAMNAGCYGAETWEIVERVQTLNRAGQLCERKAGDYEIGYRHVVLKQPGEEWFVGAWFRLKKGDGAAARKKIKELLAKRIESQPLNLPNAGSVFRNPPDDHAARLIESCGLKGFQIGGAMVSPKHANFIVNAGGADNATAADIEAVIVAVRKTVKQKTGVELVQEVRIIGEAKRD